MLPTRRGPKLPPWAGPLKDNRWERALEVKELKKKRVFPHPPASDQYQAKFDSPHFGLDPPKLSASPPHSSKPIFSAGN